MVTSISQSQGFKMVVDKPNVDIPVGLHMQTQIYPKDFMAADCSILTQYWTISKNYCGH